MWEDIKKKIEKKSTREKNNICLHPKNKSATWWPKKLFKIEKKDLEGERIILLKSGREERGGLM